MAAPTLACAVNMRAQETQQHRTANRIAGGASGDLAKLVTWLGTYCAAQIVSQVTYVVVNDHYSQAHPPGTETTVKAILKDATGGEYRINFRHLATGKTGADVATAFLATGVLLPNTQQQCTVVIVTEGPL